MLTIGLIGGMSWESTIEYYRIMNQAVRDSMGGLHSTKCLLYSVDFDEIVSLQKQEAWPELTGKLSDIAIRLKGAGADFIVICTNTMHIMADDVQANAGIPVLHIADVTGQKIKEAGLKKVGLLGTKFTMEKDFYRQRLANYGIEVIIPGEEERACIHDIIFGELCVGDVKQTSKECYLKIIDGLVARGAQGIVLGCTEIPLLIKQEDVRVPVFDTTGIHAKAAVEMALKNV